MLMWRYSKDSSGKSGQDMGAVANFRFGRKVTVSFDVAGEEGVKVDPRRYTVGEAYGTLPDPVAEKHSLVCWTLDGEAVGPADTVPETNATLVAVWGDKLWTVTFDGNGAAGDAPAAMKGYPGVVTNVPGPGTLEKAGYEFNGWTDRAGNVWTAGQVYVFADHDDVFKAKWSFSTKGIAEALGCPGRVFDATGNAPWAPADGYVVSGEIGDNQRTELSTTVTGTGTVSFDWSVSSERYFDKLEFLVDGKKVLEISGEVAWTPVEHELATEGAHVLMWRYSKDVNGASGEDCGGLRNLVIKMDR